MLLRRGLVWHRSLTLPARQTNSKLDEIAGHIWPAVGIFGLLWEMLSPRRKALVGAVMLLVDPC